MSLFNRILDKLGLRKDKPEVIGTNEVVHPTPPSSVSQTEVAPDARPTGKAPTSNKGVPGAIPGIADKRQEEGVSVKQNPSPVPAPSRAISPVDVMNMLEQRARGTGLNWKQSISDLLFLLDIDNSYAARTELAKELGAPQEVMGDSARLNTWLHKTVLRKIAENGGNIPQELLD